MSEQVFANRIKTFVQSHSVRLADDAIPESALEELLQAFTNSLFSDAIKAECSYCRAGNPEIYLTRSRKYGHRAAEGRGGANIYVPCRATKLLEMSRADANEAAR